MPTRGLGPWGDRVEVVANAGVCNTKAKVKGRAKERAGDDVESQFDID